jgi:hypothetical protein
MNLLILNLASVPAVRLLVLRISTEVCVCDKKKKLCKAGHLCGISQFFVAAMRNLMFSRRGGDVFSAGINIRITEPNVRNERG